MEVSKVKALQEKDEPPRVRFRKYIDPDPAMNFISENVCTPSINPVLIPSILEMVLYFLPVVEIMNLSLVCKMWNSESKRFLPKTKEIKIVNDNFQSAENLLEESHKKKVYLAKVECVCSSTSNPAFDKLMLFQGYQLHQLILQKCKVNVNSFICLMLEDSFPNLSILRLSHTHYIDNQNRHTLFVPNEDNLPKLNNLKFLKIEERGFHSQTSLINIAITCPNLKTIIYGNCPVPVLTRFNQRNQPIIKLESLESIQLAAIDGMKMSHEYFEVLFRLNLQSLRSITFYGMDPSGDKRMKSLKKFLKSVGPTLESLHLGQRLMFRPEYQQKGTSAFPVPMPRLKRLSLGPGFCRSLRFLDKAPNVSSFSCCRTKSADWLKIVRKGVPKPHEGMKSLDLGDISFIPLEKLGPCFPNLFKLELNLSRIENHDEAFRTIFKAFPKLTMLCIYDLHSQNKLTDSGICGIEAATMTKSWMQKVKDPSQYRKYPYVGNLPNLIDLRLQYFSGQLTDKSVLFGIKDLNSLFALDLSKSQISDISLQMIADKLTSLRSLHIRDCPNITSKGIEDFRNQCKNITLYTQLPACWESQPA